MAALGMVRMAVTYNSDQPSGGHREAEGKGKGQASSLLFA